MRKLLFLISCFLFFSANYANLPKTITRDYYVIQIFHCSTKNQVATIDGYLKNTLLPYLHNEGIIKVFLLPLTMIQRLINDYLFGYHLNQSMN